MGRFLDGSTFHMQKMKRREKSQQAVTDWKQIAKSLRAAKQPSIHLELRDGRPKAGKQLSVVGMPWRFLAEFHSSKTGELVKIAKRGDITPPIRFQVTDLEGQTFWSVEISGAGDVRRLENELSPKEAAYPLLVAITDGSGETREYNLAPRLVQ